MNPLSPNCFFNSSEAKSFFEDEERLQQCMADRSSEVAQAILSPSSDHIGESTLSDSFDFSDRVLRPLSDSTEELPHYKQAFSPFRDLSPKSTDYKEQDLSSEFLDEFEDQPPSLSQLDYFSQMVDPLEVFGLCKEELRNDNPQISFDSEGVDSLLHPDSDRVFRPLEDSAEDLTYYNQAFSSFRDLSPESIDYKEQDLLSEFLKDAHFSFPELENSQNPTVFPESQSLPHDRGSYLNKLEDQPPSLSQLDHFSQIVDPSEVFGSCREELKSEDPEISFDSENGGDSLLHPDIDNSRDSDSCSQEDSTRPAPQKTISLSKGRPKKIDDAMTKRIIELAHKNPDLIHNEIVDQIFEERGIKITRRSVSLILHRHMPDNLTEQEKAALSNNRNEVSLPKARQNLAVARAKQRDRWKTPAATKQIVIQIATEMPLLNDQQMATKLFNDHSIRISKSGIYKILQENKLSTRSQRTEAALMKQNETSQ